MTLTPWPHYFKTCSEKDGRPYTRQPSMQLQQQLWPGAAANIGYLRT